MDCALKCVTLLVLLGCVFPTISTPPLENDYEHCKNTVNKWAASSPDLEVKEEKPRLRDLLFFLHVPKTGGRTYSHCFLRKLYSGSLECPRSYDKLRFDPRKHNCRLLVTHDDYSMMSRLPTQKTSVMTILRNPVNRVFSTYEFSIELAASYLVHPNLTSVARMDGQLRSKSGGATTLDVWPWKHLVPWMREDLFARRDAKALHGGLSNRINDSYNMEDMTMPLHEYINNPIAHDIIHNGATFQIAGLTNNSYLAESHEVRRCVLKHHTLGEFVVGVAKKRLDNMLHVGLTEEHKESARIFANMVGAQVISQKIASRYNKSPSANDISEESSSPEYDQNSNTNQQNANQISAAKIISATNENMTVRRILEAYETCISSFQTFNKQRRTANLKRISPVNFSKEARLEVPEAVLQQIKSLNNLDMELYRYAQSIFSKQKQMMQKLTHELQDMDLKFDDPYSAAFGNFLMLGLLAVSILLLLFIGLFVKRRRMSKLKL